MINLAGGITFPKLATITGNLNIQFGDFTALTFPKLESLSSPMSIVGLPNLASLDLGGLGHPLSCSGISITDNPLLTSISFPPTVSLVSDNTWSFAGNALSAATINAILIKWAAASLTGGTLTLTGGTNAAAGALSGAALAARDALTGAGVTVELN